MNRVLLITAMSAICVLTAACNEQSAKAASPPVYGYISEAPTVNGAGCILRYRLSPTTTGPQDVRVFPGPDVDPDQPLIGQRARKQHFEFCKALRGGDRFKVPEFWSYN